MLNSVKIHAQYTYSFADEIEFSEGNHNFNFPQAGGLNSPNFGQLDLNMDGKMDIIIWERYGSVLLPFINIGDSAEVKYKYDPSYINLFPKEIYYWIVTADFNCDGKNDLFVSPINENLIVYENISTVSTGLQFSNPIKLRYPPWSQYVPGSSIDKPAIMDVDNDGDIDMLIFYNYSQIYYFKNMSMENSNTCGLEFINAGKCWGDITEDFNSSELLLDSCYYGDMPDGERTKGNKHAGSTIMGFDVDSNLTTDILVGDVSRSNLTLLVNGDSSSNRSNSHIISKDTLFPSYDTSVNLFSFPAAYYMDVDNDNINDLIVASFNSMRNEPMATKKSVHVYKNNGTQSNPQFAFQSQEFLIGEMIDLGVGAYPVFFDHNKDGKLDIIAGNFGHYDSTLNTFVGKLTYFENIGTTTKPKFELRDHDYADISNILPNNQTTTTQGLIPAFADIDNDGKSELLIADNRGKLTLFTDTSSANAPAAFSLVERNFDKINTSENSFPSPTFYDVNKDGLIDLIIGNNRGTLTYYPNWGTPTDPIFNLKVDSIIHLNDSIKRYYFESNSDLSRLDVGDFLRFSRDSEFGFDDNAGSKKIVAIDYVTKFVEVNTFGGSDTLFEYNSQKTAFYGIENFGGVDIRNQYYFNGDATPYFYDYKGETQMLSGSKIGNIYHYSNIDNNLDSAFTLNDTNYLNHDFGNKVFLSGGDLNGDGKEDLLIGNEAGGFKIYYASGTIGFEENEDKIELGLKLYPNPVKDQFTIELKNKNKAESYTLRIFNFLGAVILESEMAIDHLSISTENWSTGIYFVELSNSTSKEVGKIIVQR